MTKNECKERKRRKKEIRMKRKSKIKKGSKSEEQGELKMSTAEYLCSVVCSMDFWLVILFMNIYVYKMLHLFL